MKKIFQQYYEKIKETIITNAAWAFVSAVFSFLILNIPKVLTELFNSPYFLIIIANVLTILSLVVPFIIIIINGQKTNNGNETEDSDEPTEMQEQDEPTVDDCESHGTSTDNSNEEDNQELQYEDGLLDDIKFKKITVSLKMHSCDNIEYIMKYDGNATKDGIDSFEKELVWSGSKYFSTKVSNTNIDVRIEDNVENRTASPYIFKINFEEPILKDDRIKFTTTTKLSDESKSMFPISSFHVKYPIDDLILKIYAPVGMIHSVKTSCYRDLARQSQVYVAKRYEQDEDDNYKIYSVKIPNPKPWLYYTIEWKFTEQY